MDSDPNIDSLDARSVDQLETHELSVHHALVASCAPSVMSWSDSLVADSVAGSIAKGDAGGNAANHPPYDAVRRSHFYFRICRC